MWLYLAELYKHNFELWEAAVCYTWTHAQTELTYADSA